MDTGLGAKAYAIIEQGKIGLILSSRPTDRRQLIEEAAGVTKYPARRRTAELRLDAAQQNLTRVEDIVFELEKQRGTLKRQARKARRYQELQKRLRGWEKILFARKYHQLTGTLESVRARSSDARAHEVLAAAHVAAVESELSRVRIELAEAEARATAVRETVHAHELSIDRRQQQLTFDRQQVRGFEEREATIGAELMALEARWAPVRALETTRRAAAAEAGIDRDRAVFSLAVESERCEIAGREVEGLEADVEAARSEVFSAINSATALRHALEHAAGARERVGEVLSRLGVESDDVRIQLERATVERAAAAEGLHQTQESIEAVRVECAARESELASARIEHERALQIVRAHEQEIAGLEARLASLEELEAERAHYGDAPRAVLAAANGKVKQLGAVADFVDVQSGYERAVEACLGDLLEHVIVERREHAEAGLDLVREQRAGRCGFLIAAEDPRPADTAPPPPGPTPEGLVTLSSVVTLSGPFAAVIGHVVGDAWIADSQSRAIAASRTSSIPVATTTGDLFRGPQLLTGGSPANARGILETKRAVKDLRERIVAERAAASLAHATMSALEEAIADTTNVIVALTARRHTDEKALVAYDARLQRADEDHARCSQKGDQLARERRQAEEERGALDRRQLEAQESIVRLESEQRAADEGLTVAQRKLFEARDSIQELNRRVAEAGAAHAALVERAAALETEVMRLGEALAELEERARALATELDAVRRGREERLTAIAQNETEHETGVRALDRLSADVSAADDAVCALRANVDSLEAELKTARTTLDSSRTCGAELDVARATTESDLTHLVNACVDVLQLTPEEALVEMSASLEAGTVVGSDGGLFIEGGISIEEGNEEESPEPDDESTGIRTELVAGPIASAPLDAQNIDAEQMVKHLRTRIDRLGPVNMMAIEQFDELESRHAFLTSQRKDLVESIAQTGQAIKRIDETTRKRFAEAFEAINKNFQETFSTLFGGGRAGLTLVDEDNPLESGIEIVAQPPGKRLQSIQLLSGGEKALTAIALMFGLFRYKPSPFCLLDEIDAPLDDANIGRFVEMLRAMQQHTQFILITHNRKTMEIADRLYGVTMEEPGVSKLISVQLN